MFSLDASAEENDDEAKIDSPKEVAQTKSKKEIPPRREEKTTDKGNCPDPTNRIYFALLDLFKVTKLEPTMETV